MKIFDISHHQGSKFPFQQMKEYGFEGVILRTGDGKMQDREFLNNLVRAQEAGLKIGVYHFSRAISQTEGENEAKLVEKLLDGYIPTLGIYLDMEVYKDKSIHSAAYTGFTRLLTRYKGLCEIGIYTNEYNYNNYFDKEFFAGVRKWIAKYSSSSPSIGQEIWAWQYTSSGDKHAPYSKALDLSIVFDQTLDEDDGTIGVAPEDKRYMPDIVEAVLNNEFGTGETRKQKLEAIGLNYTEVQRAVNAYWNMAQEVITGKYGNQPQRQGRVEALGYDYDVVQQIVNAILHK